MEAARYEIELIVNVGKTALNRHREALWAIDKQLRDRVIKTLQLGLSIPLTLSHVQKGAVLPDENFDRYIRYVAANLIP